MYFETEEDLRRERKAIETYANTFGFTFEKLGKEDIDFRLLDKDRNVIGYAEIKGRVMSMRDAYPLPLSAHKALKLYNKRLNPIVIWSCDDGIIYANLDKLVGTFKLGGRSPRPGSISDKELMVYYDRQRTMKYIRFI